MQVTAPFEPAIVATDLDTMLGFYRDVLGMGVFSLDSIDAATSRAAGLTPGGYTIARLETAGGDRLKIVAPVEPPPAALRTEHVMQRHGLAYLTYIVPDLRAVIETVIRAGGRMRTGPEPVAFRPGIVELAFAEDPEGNCLEFVQRNDLAKYRPQRRGSAP